MTKNSLLLLIFGLVLIGITGLNQIALATTNDGSTYQLNQKIPGMSSGVIDIKDANPLGVYVSAWYNFIVAVVGLLATVMMMWGGFKWLASRGNAGEIGQAKEAIWSAVIGLILALLSYTILFIINPNLLTLQTPGLGVVEYTDSVDITVAKERDNVKGPTATDSSYWTAGDPIRYTQSNEGYNPCVYTDSLGNPTVGYGHLVTASDNLSTGDCIDADRAQQLFIADYQSAITDAQSFVGGETNWSNLDPDRRTALVDMAFNLGGSGLNGFVDLQRAVTTAITSGNNSYWLVAGDEIINSQYGNQLPNRARRNANIIVHGTMDVLLGM